MEIKRKGNRMYDEIREIKITKGFLKYASGSCLIEMGDTKVLCAVNYEDKVPQWLKDTGNGWITAEYSLLPSSTQDRIPRSSISSGRTQEIQRMIGRSLRGVVDLKRIGERTFWVDCDVIQADGGTRVAGVIGGFVALVECLNKLKKAGLINVPVLKDYIGAISVGIVYGNILLDLDYSEDSLASVDLNIVMTGNGEFVEIQGTAEGYPFTKKQLEQLLIVAEKGINKIIEIEKQILKDEIIFLLGH
ncbi:MAG: ribonuclease PH [bacterium]|nr:ribonuclease PH [bacterium]